jgi:methylmalonyl-CoA mutase N-terminal domain/subunit
VRYQREIESGKRVIVGVNQFTEGSEETAPRFTVDSNVAKVQREKLAKLRATRDNAAVAATLGRLRAAAQDPKAPLMPEILTSVKTYATTGEICDTLRSVFGEYQPPTVI